MKDIRGKMTEDKTKIPDTKTLKERIRAELRPEAEGEDDSLTRSNPAREFDYHNLLVRIMQQGFKGRIKRLVFYLTRFITLWQEQFNRHIQQAADELAGSAENLFKRQKDLEADVSGLGSRAEELGKGLSGLENRMEERFNETDERLSRAFSELEEFKESLKEELASHRRLVHEHRHTLSKFLEAAGPAARGEPDAVEKDALMDERDHFLDGMYEAFEDRFRGSRETVRQRLSVYLPVVSKNFNTNEIYVLDIGCGRGEWLECLEKSGIRAKGIDINRLAVSQCLEYGLDAEEAEALEFLKASPEGSFQAVTGFHIIEHMPFEQLIGLTDEIYRVLSPGGVMVFETPNPVNILVGANDFHRDPSHVKPVHPDTARFAAEYRGFVQTCIKLLKDEGAKRSFADYDSWPFDSIENYVDIPRDYALIGFKKTA